MSDFDRKMALLDARIAVTDAWTEWIKDADQRQTTGGEWRGARQAFNASIEAIKKLEEPNDDQGGKAGMAAEPAGGDDQPDAVGEG